MPPPDRPSRPARVQRSVLTVPATSRRLFEQAENSAANFVFLDLEDAVASARNADAREATIAALNELDWADKTRGVRFNGLGTEWVHRDTIEVASRCPRLDLILLPKVGAAFEVQLVATLLTGMEPNHPSAPQFAAPEDRTAG